MKRAHLQDPFLDTAVLFVGFEGAAPAFPRAAAAAAAAVPAEGPLSYYSVAPSPPRLQPPAGQRAAARAAADGSRPRRPTMPTVPELKAQCNALHLSTKGTKGELQARLDDPDAHRVMVGSISLKVNTHLSIAQLRLAPALYLELRHPQSANIQQWKERLGFDGGGFSTQKAADSVIYGMAQFLGSKRGPNPAAFPPAAPPSSPLPPLPPPPADAAGGTKRKPADPFSGDGSSAATPATKLPRRV